MNISRQKTVIGNTDISQYQHPTKKDRDGNPLIDMDKMAPEVAAWAISTAKTIPNTMSDLVKETEDAKIALRSAVDGIGSDVEALKPIKKQMIDELRGLRMTTVTEVSSMMRALEDIRKFFLGSDHDKEVARLREFVDLCERLQKLKESGFLDTVADTIIKVS